MTKYLVFLASGIVEVDADMVRTENNYPSPVTVEGNQPTVCFYRGRNPTQDYVIAEFIKKNIGGYGEASKIKFFPYPELTDKLLR